MGVGGFFLLRSCSLVLYVALFPPPKYAAKVYSPIETFWCREENKFFIEGLKSNTTADQKVSEGDNGAYWLHQ